MKQTGHKKADIETARQFPFFQKERNNNVFGQTNKPFFTPSCIQAKLTINQPNDKYEQEADAMADKVVQRLPVPSTNDDSSNNANKLSVQRKCAACEHEEEE